MEAPADPLIRAVERYCEAAGLPAGAVDPAAIVAPGEPHRVIAGHTARAALRKVPPHAPPGRLRRTHPGCGAMPAMLATRAEGLLSPSEEEWVAAQARQCAGCAQLMAVAERALRAFQAGLAAPEEDAHPWLPAGIAAPDPPATAAEEPGAGWLPEPR